jgi:hypothetical protein
MNIEIKKKIYYKQLGEYGRLGNQLFQIASTVGIAKKVNKDASFPEWQYAKYFPNVQPYIEQNCIDSKNNVKVFEKKFEYSSDIEDFCDIPVSNELYGYFQSHKYFNKHDVKTLFKFSDEVHDCVREAFPFLYETENQDHNYCFVHIRRGDYLTNGNYEKIDMMAYYNKMDFYDKYIIVSDDIEYCKFYFNNIINMPCIYFSEMTSDTIPSEILDLCLMSKCYGAILGNSTFSYWGAMLSYAAPNNIYRPSNYFKNKLKHNSLEDFYPIMWREYDIVASRNTLEEITFTIPVFYDHQDRYDNLVLSLKMLYKYFDVRVIIMEEENNFFEDIVTLFPKERITYVKCNNGIFHRTKMLNHMTVMSVTRYIMNWDSDVMVSPISILRTMTLLRSGVTLVYPYNGTFIRIEREKWFDVLMDKLDIDLLYNQEFEDKKITSSLGGAVAFNKELYTACGLENENFISFGAEDVERYERVRKLHSDLSIVSSNGPLYHMNHFKGINSTTNNPYFSQNKLEYEKVANMTKEELTTYISSWNQTQPLTS